ncbi:protein HGH1 homolog isoform X3 [Corapipo altera]|uniref:protein HGH1 homolog isoform X3 n=1 Tax=Corapipo altera TaxID=415028 RepID=UPI000FD6674A|nr:protein HGH1 homolog isoform X3 [Corapipo altera]
MGCSGPATGSSGSVRGPQGHPGQWGGPRGAQGHPGQWGDPEVLRACHRVIQVLIGDEPEAGLENLLEVTVPEEVEQQLQRLDREEEEEWRKSREQQEGRGTRDCPQQLSR